MRVLIVDDEQYIVEYLKHLVDWGSFGFKEVITTNKSHLAQQVIEEQQIDLIISDIRMPEISGIDLLKSIYEKKIKTRIIFLSGHTDFEYAQTAIHYGASDYLLKPLTQEQLEDSLTRLFKKDSLEVNEPQIQTPMNVFRFLIDKICFNFTQIEEIWINEEQAQFVFYRIRNTKLTKSLMKYSWKGEFETWGFVPENSSSQIVTLSGKCSVPFTFSNDDQLRVSFYRFFGGMEYHHQYYESMTNCQLVHQFKEDYQIINTALFQESISTPKGKLLIMECLAVLLTKGFYISPTAILYLQEEKMMEYLRSTIVNVENKRKIKPSVILIEKANQFIKASLHEDLNLEDIASVLYIHPAYLSKLYKQETGMNLSTYIMNCRMEKARELLIHSKLLVSDIGKMVGYKTSQYFIKLFKEKYEMTPQQYRRTHL